MAAKTWQGGFGNWTNASGWSPAGVPGGGDDVINSEGTPTIFTAVPTIASLNLSSRNPLEVYGRLTVTGTITIGGNGIFVAGFLSAAAVRTTTASSGITVTGAADAPAEFDITGRAGLGMDGGVTGSFRISGYSVVKFANGSLTDIAQNGSLSINGPHAFIGGSNSNAAVAQLERNAGMFSVGGGAAITVAGSFANTGFINLDEASDAGGSQLTIGGTLTNSRVVQVGNATTSASSVLTVAALENTGTVTLAGYGANVASLKVQGALTGNGTINVTASELEVVGAASNRIVFPGPQFSNAGGGGHGVLKLDAPGSFTGTISGFSSSKGDTLDLAGEIATIDSYDGSTLVVRVGDTTQSFALSGPAPGSLITVSDGAGGTDIVVCFCAGTRITTPIGDRPVEDLRIGDLVVTASGAHRSIRWLGRRSYVGRFANRNPGVLPICFKAGSLADGVPARDLWVSPKHAMFLDAVLVPAEHLVNGVSVVQATRVDRVDYHHVELDSHDVLLAEGAPSESFVDDQGRHIFHNAHEHAALYPDALRTDAVYCAPRIEHGDALETIRRRLYTRARALVPAKTA